MKSLSAITVSVFFVLLFSGCKKTPDYVSVPYTCACGGLTWQGVGYELLDANVVRHDPEEPYSRRYYITAKVQLEGEAEPHGLGVWIEIPSVEDGDYYYINQQQGLTEYVARIHEFNLNDPIDTLRTFIPLEGTVLINESPLNEGTETGSFQMILKELQNNVPVGFPKEFSGSFRVNLED